MAVALGAAAPAAAQSLTGLTISSVTLPTAPAVTSRNNWPFGNNNRILEPYLLPQTTAQTIRFSGIGFNEEERHSFCNQTAVLILLAVNKNSNCRYLGTGKSSLSVSLTQAEVTRGYVIWHTWTSTGGNNLDARSVSARWVPIATVSNLTLSPAFDGATTAYTATRPAAATGLRVTPTGTGTLTVSVNGGSATTVGSGATHLVDALQSGTNTVTISAASGGMTETYTVSIGISEGVTVDTDLTTPGAQATTLSVTEALPTPDGSEAKAYTLVLKTAPSGPVTVTATSDDAAVAVDTDGTPETRVLTFTAGNWNTAQTVTATAVADANGVGETVTVAHAVTSADTSYDGASAASVTVAVTDDDVPGLAVSVATLEIAEPAGGSLPTGEYTVRLSTEPTGMGTVTVGITETPADDPDIAASPTALTFDASNWATGQTVTVTPQADADAGDDTTTLRHAVTGSGATEYPAELAAVDVMVKVDDAQTAGLVVDTEPTTPATAESTPLALTEDHATDGSKPYTMVLAHVPTAEVTVTLTASPPGAVTVVPGALTFSTTTWGTAQTVTASAVTDDDAVDAPVTLMHALTGAAEYAALEAVEVSVTVEDDEEQAIWVNGSTTPHTVMLTEDHATEASATYTVELGSAPLAPVVVRIGSDNPEVHALPGLLQFSATDWNTAQTVTVRADGDADARADAAALTHTAAGGDYTGLAAVTVAVEVTDDDAAVELSRRAVTVQGGGHNTYTVRLAAQPAGPVTVTVESPDADVAVGPAASPNPRQRALEFTVTTWQTPQAVTVTGETVMSDKNVTVTHTVSGYGAGTTAADVTVTVLNATGALRVDPLAIVLLEDGLAKTYTVQPRVQPADPVTVTVVVDDTNANVSTVPTELTFDADGWAAQAVTVTAETDSDTTPGTATVNHTVETVGFSAQSLSPVAVMEEEDTVPTLGAVPNRTVRAGQAVNVRLPAATGGNAPLSYALTPALPTGLGLTFSPTTRRIQGTPQTTAEVATYTLTATDLNRDAVSQTFTLTVEANPLGFSSGAEPYTPGETYTLPAPDVASGTPVLTFVLDRKLPAGLTYVPPTPDAVTGAYATGGQIVGTPTGRVPTAPYTLTVIDRDGNEAELTFALATGTAAPGPAPVPEDRQPTFGAVTVPAQVYRQGEAIAPLGLPAATDGEAPLRYALTPALPAGLTYTAPADATGGGTLAGVPAAAQAATTYTLTATDADGDTATLTFTITVEAAGPIRAQAGTRTYQRHGQQVTVTQAPGTPAGVVVTLPPTLAQDVTITVTPAGAEVPLARGRYGFGPAGAEVAVDITVTPVPADGLGVCLPVLAAVRTAAAGRTVELLHYDGRQWAPVAGSRDDAPDGQVCAPGVTTFSPFAVGYANDVPRFGETVPSQTYLVNEAIAPLVLPAATGGDGVVRYTLTPLAALPAGLRYTPPADPTATGGVIAGTPTEGRPPTAYRLTATDADGDADTVTFTIEVVRIPVQVTIGDALAVEGAAVEFPVTLSRAVARALTLRWTAGRPGSATPGDDYAAEGTGRLGLAAGTTAGTLRVPTVDDRRVEPTETFTVTVTLPDDPLFESAEATATGRIEDDDTEQARQRSLGMVLAGVGRTLATDAVDVIGDRFGRPPGTPQATVGGQALSLHRAPQTGRWRQAAGVTYGVARALGVEVGSPLAGGDGQFGQVRGAAWHTLTRHLRDPHAAAAPLSAWDAPGAFPAPTGTGSGGPPHTGWGALGHAGAVDSIPLSPGRGAGATPFGRGAVPGLAGYGTGLGQLGFDRAHAATPQAMKVGAFRAPVQFRRVSGAEVLSQSEFELPLRQPAADAPTPVGVTEADPAAPIPPVETAPQAAAAAWTLWGRGTASGFDGKPKDDFSMDGTVFTGYLGLDYRLQPNVLLGLAVAHSQGDVDYETRDVTKGEVDLTLTSVLPYAHWSPRPGLGVWGLFGAGWGDLQLHDEAGKVKTDLEMLMAAVGARQEVLTWRRLDVALKADAFLTELEAGADDRLPKTAGDAQRLRLMVEGRTAWAISEESHLTPVFEIGGRWDGGKAETGVGAELGGGFAYAHTKLGLGIEARGRYLLTHQKSAFDEWGASLTLKLDPGEAKRGLWLAVAPVWGAEASQVEQLWGSADVLQAGADSATPGLSPAQVEFDVGYGLVTHEGAGLLTTYGGVSMAGPQRHGYRVGGRIELGEWIDLSVEGERTTQGSGAAHQVALYGHLGW